MNTFSRIAYLLITIFCHVVVAEDAHMWVTKETSYMDVCRRYAEGSLHDADFQLFVRNESVPEFPIYSALLFSADTTFIIHIKKDGKIGCLCSRVNNCRASELGGGPLTTYVETYIADTIVEYVKAITTKHPLYKGNTVQFDVYPELYDLKIEHHMFLYYKLYSMFPENITVVHIGAPTVT